MLLVTTVSHASSIGDEDRVKRILAAHAIKLLEASLHLSTGLKLLLHESVTSKLAELIVGSGLCMSDMVGSFSLDNGPP